MHKIKTMLLATGLVAATSMTPALAQTTLTVSSWGGPNHGINTHVWPNWGQWVEEATEGRVTVEVVSDLGPPNQQMDIVADGIGDVTWMFHGHFPGRFTATQLPELPFFEAISSEKMSAAYWRTHQEYLSAANEHRGVKVLGLGVHGPGQVFTRERVESLDQLEGKRLRTGGGVMSEIANRLGVSGVALPPTQTYESASQGVIEGAFLTLEGLRSFRIAEVAPYTLSLPGGLYRGSFAIVINPDVWDSISASDQEAIMEVSGERLSRLFGEMMDLSDQAGVEFAKEKGNTFTEASSEVVEAAKQLTADLPDDWVERMNSSRVDAEAALAFFRKQLQELN
ncbi:TRAP-type C4-dicarboxylate transport system, substrate-binding protein [Marinospirillum celere]|uniref:TRAP-type C4-dicarboxylate transport system, substrate-binding protein n=1 Tax=Marinospirillum celere TaxID=1122252 RepID=A0A1I1FTT7_9GAMM|nr:TRAP transporter substrate-binding protein [Marinospirillum celere]SFC01048.1 TRAP-type C4-dicarboxylate transport system, substrate-binding protein [Marinospirillum celere]